MEKIIIAGYGGHGKSVADCIERSGIYRIMGYTDTEPRTSRYAYLGTDDVLETYFNQEVVCAAVGIGYMGKGNVREKLYGRLKAIGYHLPIISDPSSVISDTALIGEGSFVGKGAVVNAEAVVGKMAIINTMALVEHECVVEDYSHVAVAAVLCGQVKVGEAAFIGANATVIQGRTVEPHRIVPAGTTVR